MWVNMFICVFCYIFFGMVVWKEYIFYFEDCDGLFILLLENWFVVFFKVLCVNYFWFCKVVFFRLFCELGMCDL